MWKKTFEYLKDHLSPETIEKYGSREEEPAQADECAGNVDLQGKEDKPQSDSEEAM